MPTDFKHQKLHAVPAQIIKVPDGVILKRGCSEVKISGPSAAEAVQTVLTASSNGGATRSNIRALFARSSGSRVDKLVQQLLDRGFLVGSNGPNDSLTNKESCLDIFFWHFGETASRVVEQLNKVHLTIIGVNYISRQLVTSLLACGHSNFEIFDHLRHRNLRLFSESGTLKDEGWVPLSNYVRRWIDGEMHPLGNCLVVTSDFGGQDGFRQWNKLCLEQGVKFLPVMLKNMTGYVGPLVIPGETACYECLLARQRTYSQEEEAALDTDKCAFESQHVVGFHPSMATLLGDIAAFELTRFYVGVPPGRKVGKLLEINLLASAMTERPVLKVPRCVACSPLRDKACINLKKMVFNEKVS